MRVVLVAVVALCALPLARAAAQPQIPSTFYGTANIEGKTPPPDTDVRGFVDGVDCTQLGPGVRFIIENGVGLYVVSVMHESQKPGCGKEGKTVTFTVGGEAAPQTAPWKAGPQEVNLNAGEGTPLPLPTATPVTPGAPTATPAGGSTTAGPSAGASPRPTGPLPTDDIQLTPVHAGTPGAVTAVGRANRAGDSDGFPAWAIVVIVVAALGAAGAGGGYALSRRPRGDPPPPPE
jgi:hypothetical protein